jgi:hypothetical protein
MTAKTAVHFFPGLPTGTAKIPASLTEAQGGSGGSSGVTLVPIGEQVPAGTAPGLVAFVPIVAPEEPMPVATVSYDTEGTTVECPIPEGVEVGDAVVFIPAFDPATSPTNDITGPGGSWTEIFDYSGNQSRESAVYVYRVTDVTALANLGETVTATYGASGRRMGVVFAVRDALTGSAWPTYTSGSNRSAATINNNSTGGCTVQGFATATVPFFKVVLFIVHDADSQPVASAGFEEVGVASGSAGGAAARTLTVLIKDQAAVPIAAADVTHPTATSSTHGGGQFIVPAPA